jgi:hypothetical protein
MKKIDFIKLIKENNGALDLQNIEKVAQTVDKLGDSVSKLKDMGVFEGAEDLELNNLTNRIATTISELGVNGRVITPDESKEFEPLGDSYNNPYTETVVDGFTLKIVQGNVKDEQKTWLLYADEKLIAEFMSDVIEVNRVLENLKKSDGEEKIQENFVNSKLFSIIAEAEMPKISKKEILEFLK